MNQGSFTGWEKYEGIQVIESEGMKKVLLRGQPYMSWGVEDEASQRMAIVQLYDSGLGSQEKLAEIFGVHVNSVQNYITAFTKDGITGLVNRQSGPMEAWKVTPEMRFKVLEIAFRNRDISYEGIVKVLKERWNENVSINSIRQVLAENGFIQEHLRKDDLWQQGDLFGQSNKDQLEFEFPRSSNSQEGPFILNQNERDCSDSKTKNRSYYSQPQRRYLDQIEQGEYSVYAGGLLFVPLLERYNFLAMIKQIINIETHEGYSLEEICLTLFYFDLFRFQSMEDFKTVYPEEFSILIGRESIPSVWTLRRFLHKVKKLGKSEELIEEFAKEYLRRGIAKWGVLYIDSHFLVYYGVYTISMGWHGVRKIPMKGSYNFLVVDEKFSPVLFLIRSSSEDLLKKIPEIILKAKKLAREIGISEEEIEDVTVIFDREGYSAELFRILDGKESGNGKFKVRFISWAKYADRWVDEIEGERFDKSVTVTYEIQESEEIKYFEIERVMNKYGKVRTIVIESGTDKKRAAIYTNDKEIPTERVIQLICRRWGQENLIKELMYKHEIEYSPGYEANEIEDQPLVENPKVKEIKEKIANLKGDLSQIKSRFGHEVLEEMEREANWEEIKEKRILTIADIEGIRSQITLLEQEIDKHPKMVKFDEAHGKKLMEFNYDRKRFLDCIKVFTYNTEKRMCGILSHYYDRKKEILPALGMIVKRGGYVKLRDGRLTVQLRRFKDPDIDYATRHLCEDLNQMKPFTVDRFHLPIHYEVILGREPTKHF